MIIIKISAVADISKITLISTVGLRAEDLDDEGTYVSLYKKFAATLLKYIWQPDLKAVTIFILAGANTNVFQLIYIIFQFFDKSFSYMHLSTQ